MTDLASHRAGLTVSLVVVLGVVVLALAIVLIVAAWRARAGERRWSALAPARPRAAWVTALVAAVALAGLAVAYVFVPAGGDKTAGQLSGQEQSAVVAAGTIAVDLATFSRANFDKDFTRALDVTTGDLHSDLTKQKATTKSTLTKGKFDLYAKVQHSALVGPVAPTPAKDRTEGFVVLVALYGYTTSSPQTPNPQNLQVTVEKIKGKWLASDVTSIGIQ